MSVTSVAFNPRTQDAVPGQPSNFTVAHADALFHSKFAPWVQDLNLIVEECLSTGARVRLPHSPRLTRVGNTICGQSMMAAADSAMAIAITAAFGEFRNITTVSQTISFMRSVSDVDVIVEATVSKLGKSLLFGEAIFRAAGSTAIAAHATATWALIP